ncbi:MAG: hypothetical protein O2992_00140 [Gemmatimonadetes bacterium]|nr:hypothetical protein [Gemmatimonadota bacterium]
MRGQGVAIDMGVDYFEYEVAFEGEVFVLSPNAYGAMAGDNPQRETWTFTEGDHYEWVLMAEGADGAWRKRMGGTYERRER